MTGATPQIACVRPRARLRTGEPALPLDELLEDYRSSHPTGVVWLDGPVGSGKSTALAYLAARFEYDDRFRFLDNPPIHQIRLLQDVALVVITGKARGDDADLILQLQPWGFDDLLEYLLANHRDQCQSVIRRLGSQSKISWRPELARVVLDRMAADERICDLQEAILASLDSYLKTHKQSALAKQASLAWQSSEYERAMQFMAQVERTLPAEAARLMRHDQVQQLLAAEQITELIGTRSLIPTLKQRFSPVLIETVGRRIESRPEKIADLQTHFQSYFSAGAQAMIASILHVADPGWMPRHGPMMRMKLSGGYFSGARWQDVRAAGSNFSRADLSDACLQDAILISANLTEANCNHANLHSANMEK